MRLADLQKVNAERRARRAVLTVVDLAAGTQRVILEDSLQPADPLAALARERFRSGASGMAETADGPRFLGVSVPPPRLVVVGAVHISQALAPIAAVAGYDMTVVDPRTAFATVDRFPGVPLLAEWPQEALPRLGLDRYTALVTLTHDPKIDDPALELGIAAGCFYLGALGSRKTHARRLERLGAAGMAPEALGRIHAPVGLDLGGRAPPEIAVAVMAQVIQALRKGGAPGR